MTRQSRRKLGQNVEHAFDVLEKVEKAKRARNSLRKKQLLENAPQSTALAALNNEIDVVPFVELWAHRGVDRVKSEVFGPPWASEVVDENYEGYRVVSWFGKKMSRLPFVAGTDRFLFLIKYARSGNAFLVAAPDNVPFSVLKAITARLCAKYDVRVAAKEGMVGMRRVSLKESFSTLGYIKAKIARSDGTRPDVNVLFI